MVRSFSWLFLIALVPMAAQALPDSHTMSCRDLTELVRSAGNVEIAFYQDASEHFVASESLCSGSISHPALLNALDNHACWVGYVCGEAPAYIHWLTASVMTSAGSAKSGPDHDSNHARGGGGVTVGGATTAGPND